jgi:hypothetical protein
MNEKLLSCPFCGAKVEMKHEFPADKLYSVWCENDNVCSVVCHTIERTEEMAAENWNTRYYPPEVQEVIEAAQRVVDCQAVFNGVFEAVEKLADKLDAYKEMEAKHETHD